MKKIIVFFALLGTFLLSACEQKTDSSTDLTLETTPETSIKTSVVNAEITSEKSGADTGKQTYELFCAGCHNAGEGHAGTMKLTLLKGEENSVITDRTDLNADYIRFVVRDGLLEMAPFRPTDISDSELDSLIQYILSDASRSDFSAKNAAEPAPE